ncbi:AAA family ATPase [Seleniivibrio woodruffii]|uniref:AAA family ATPase n=1 Tax=Seleniivibrio woodruffii TaxID=1078050 RepID=UPI0026F0FB0E|nr:AAA family ATPase [Seleniivibrio woodruffii]
MSRDLFGFKGEPFSVHPDNRYFFSSISHDKAITLLEYGINSRKGFMLLTGLKGTGKTMTCSILQEGLSGVNAVLVPTGVREPEKLLAEICKGFGLDYSLESYESAFGKLMQYFVEQYKEGRNSLIIIDDAEIISDACLSLLNSFMEIEIEQCKLVQVILCGTPALHDRLKSVSSQLGPKFTFTVELAALSMKDTADYVEHRLKKALGEDFPLFRKNSYIEIYHYSKGIPSEINRIAQKAIEIATDKKASRVTSVIVKQAAASLYGVSRRRTVKLLPVFAALALVFGGAYYMMFHPVAKKMITEPAVTVAPEPVEPVPAEADPQTEPLKKETQQPADVKPVPAEPAPVPEPVKEEPQAPAQPKFGCVEASSGLKIRKSPSRNAASIGNAPNRARVELVKKTKDGEWWEIRYKGKDGYMFAEFVKPSETGECRR